MLRASAPGFWQLLVTQTDGGYPSIKKKLKRKKRTLSKYQIKGVISPSKPFLSDDLKVAILILKEGETEAQGLARNK